MPFATACCGIELMQTGGPRTDLDRFGMVPRSSPRQSDLLIVAGTITYKMADRVRLLYAQIPQPKYVISMGSCSNCGGLFTPSYSVVNGVDKIIPVDLYLPGCPPRPEALMHGIIELRSMVHEDPTLGWRARYSAYGTEEVVPKPAADATGVNVFGAGGTEDEIA
jgi:NADH-quinone oxidoreductase subunit B